MHTNIRQKEYDVYGICVVLRYSVVGGQRDGQTGRQTHRQMEGKT